jgi:hypothetical protein
LQLTREPPTIAASAPEPFGEGDSRVLLRRCRIGRIRSVSCDQSPHCRVKALHAIAAMSQNRVDRLRATASHGICLRTSGGSSKQPPASIIVMGRKTFESIGRVARPNDGRAESRGFVYPGVRTISCWEELTASRDELERRFFFVEERRSTHRHCRCVPIYISRWSNGRWREILSFPSFEDQFELVSNVMERTDFRILHYRNRDERSMKRQGSPSIPLRVEAWLNYCLPLLGCLRC